MSSAFRAVAKTFQPRAFSVCAAQSPIPDEQPVMRTDRSLMLMPCNSSFSGSCLVLVAGFAAFRRQSLLLDALEARHEDVADRLFRLLIAHAIGVEGCLPKDVGAIRPLVVLLDPELGRVILDRQRTLDDLIAVARVVGLQELFLDLAAVFQRERTEGRLPLLAFLA